MSDQAVAAIGEYEAKVKLVGSDHIAICACCPQRRRVCLTVRPRAKRLERGAPD